MTVNVFVLGLDEHNEQVLRELPDAGRYRFHPLLSIEELQFGEEIPLRELLDKATRQLEEFAGSVDAVMGFWDFPVSTMIPILCRRIGGLPSASLEAVVKCEHKYWSRLEQQQVIDEYPRFGLVDPEHDTDPPDGLEYPLWIKPVKSYSSDLAFGVSDRSGFLEALDQIRDGIGRLGAPFETAMEDLDLPPEIAEAGGQVCVAEEAVSGRQLTLEGYRHDGRTYPFGVVDSVTHEDSSSFVRFQYPASIPRRLSERMADIADRILTRVGLENTTFNIEFFWREDTDALRVLEVNPRHSQSHAELFAQVDGAPNHLAMLRLALGEDPGMPRGKGPYPIAAKWFQRYWHDGVVRRHPSAEEIERVECDIPGVTVDVIAHEGDRLSELVDQDSYSYKIANVYVGAEDEAGLREKFERCVARLPFEIDGDGDQDSAENSNKDTEVPTG